MERTAYIVAVGLVRLLSVCGGLWLVLLVAVAGIWSSSHMVIWGVLFGTTALATVCLFIGIPTITSRKQIYTWIVLSGACVIASLGLTSLISNLRDHSNNASLGFVVVFWATTFLSPAFVILFCVNDLRQARTATRRSPFSFL